MTTDVAHVEYRTGGTTGVFEIVISLSDGTRSALKCMDTGIALSRYYDGAWHLMWSK